MGYPKPLMIVIPHTSLNTLSFLSSVGNIQLSLSLVCGWYHYPPLWWSKHFLPRACPHRHHAQKLIGGGKGELRYSGLIRGGKRPLGFHLDLPLISTQPREMSIKRTQSCYRNAVLLCCASLHSPCAPSHHFPPPSFSPSSSKHSTHRNWKAPSGQLIAIETTSTSIRVCISLWSVRRGGGRVIGFIGRGRRAVRKVSHSLSANKMNQILCSPKSICWVHGQTWRSGAVMHLHSPPKTPSKSSSQRGREELRGIRANHGPVKDTKSPPYSTDVLTGIHIALNFAIKLCVDHREMQDIFGALISLVSVLVWHQ